LQKEGKEMSKNIDWKTEKRKLRELVPDPNNPRRMSAHDNRQLKKSLEKFNLASIPVIDTSNNILAGHQRIRLLKTKHGADHEIDVRVPSRDMTEEEITEYRLRDNRNHGEFDYDILANNFDIDYLEDVGFRGGELVGFETDEFEDEFYKYDNTNAEMPIVPKFNEKYTALVVFCDNEMDENWLRNVFDLGKAKCYKSSRVAPNHVIHVKELQKAING